MRRTASEVVRELEMRVARLENRTAKREDSQALQEILNHAVAGDWGQALNKFHALESRAEMIFWSFNQATIEAVSATTGLSLSMIGSYETSNLNKFVRQLQKDLVSKNATPFIRSSKGIMKTFDEMVSKYEHNTATLKSMS